MIGPGLIVYVGDAVAIGFLTLIGFAWHDELSTALWLRMLATFLPLTVGWFLLAPWFGLFKQEVTADLKQLWRPVLAMVFAAPLAVVIRGLILNAAILPSFAVVLGATSAAGMVIWRGLYFLMKRKS